MRRQLEVSNDTAAALSAGQDSILRELGSHVACEVFLRGNLVTLDGDPDAVQAAATVVRELGELIDAGHEVSEGTIQAITTALDQHKSPATVLEDVVWRHRSTKVAPKSVNQKRYVDAIRTSTVTFGIGPAGTGKTFLAVAMAAHALARKEVNRVILTRPAVEAGERLGFLPGDLMAKIDPYLRPLFDALNDMLDPEKVAGFLEKGVIEVAPLAFMRGRAQPVDQPVLTPDGWRPIGSLRVGDLVVGSDGRPTPVLGVFPQGRREVFRVEAQDGAATRCCAEHLWFVTDPDDGTGEVLRTDEIARALPARRFGLPLLSSPAEFVPQDVPVDPYELGLRLGRSTERGLDPTSRAQLRVRCREGAVTDRSGVLLADPPARLDAYLHNSAAIRHALLQGVLDAAGAPVAAGVRCTLAASDLGDDVTYLVRSLGGVTYRHDAHVLDIRLPAGLAPFRLTRKRERYEADGGGRPMRFVTRIEPDGEAETVCISVGAADSLYVTDDFLVTHNTLNDSFIILDEAQNTTPEQMKMFLTRLGFGSKMVITGDVTQIDLPRNEKSGLLVVNEILREVEGVEFVHFGGADVVRHRLVQRIVEAYDAHAGTGTAELRPADRRRA